MNIYSFKDITLAIAHPLAGSFIAAGQVGMGQITIVMSTEKSIHDVAADGTVMVSFISGDNGVITIEIQQTSELNSFLLAWYNLIKTAADQHDITDFASMAITLRSVTDGTTHVARGISPLKIPDKPYAAQGQKVSWSLLAGDIQTMAA